MGQSIHLGICAILGRPKDLRLGPGVPCLVAPYVLDVIPDEKQPLQK